MMSAATPIPAPAGLPSLADMIEEDYHSELLKSGNLPSFKIRQTLVKIETRAESGWTGENNWTSLGYVARLLRQTCHSCGESSDHVLGVFHDERNGRGDLRSLRLDSRAQFPSLREIKIEQEIEVPYCGDCLSILKG